VQLGDGTTVDGDLLVVGIGATPNLDLARTAGLDVGDGVLADEHLRTSDPDVFVAGDIAEAQHPTLGRRLRVEHWDNAQQQGALAARTALGSDDVYDKLPFFFTDQYDLGAEYVGHVGPEGADEVVVRGDLDAAVFTAFWVRDGRVTAAMHANEWDSTQHLRAVVTAGTVDLAALRDPDVPLGDLAG
jgi:3-phenylpropionate/trans-cinnamate dioxygenase ferredoxin reductase subunit